MVARVVILSVEFDDICRWKARRANGKTNRRIEA